MSIERLIDYALELGLLATSQKETFRAILLRQLLLNKLLYKL